MDARLMPQATFRCEVCGEQQSITLDLYERRVGKPDRCLPHPHHHKQRMELVQVDYQGRV